MCPPDAGPAYPPDAAPACPPVALPARPPVAVTVCTDRRPNGVLGRRRTSAPSHFCHDAHDAVNVIRHHHEIQCSDVNELVIEFTPPPLNEPAGVVERDDTVMSISEQTASLFGADCHEIVAWCRVVKAAQAR